MAAMSLTARRVPAAGQLISKLISSRSVFTFRYSVLNEDSSSADETGLMITPDAKGKTPEGDCGKRIASEVWEDSKGLHGRFDMKGLDKEHVKVWAEGELVIVRGEDPEKAGSKVDCDAAVGRKCGGVMQTRPGMKLSEICAEMKFGVLSILVPAADNEHGEAVNGVMFDDAAFSPH